LLKQKARIIGFDDGYFIPKTKGMTPLIGLVQRIDGRIEGCLTAEISIDGLDATEKIISMLSGSRFKKQVKAVMLSGINFAGFNIADVSRIHSRLKLPVIIVFRKQPNLKKIFSALSEFNDAKKRINLIRKGGRIFKGERYFFQCLGIGDREAMQLIKRNQLHSIMPECLRLAHIIASAVSRGESSIA
jgi:hypothetical protein